MAKKKSQTKSFIDRRNALLGSKGKTELPNGGAGRAIASGAKSIAGAGIVRPRKGK